MTSKTRQPTAIRSLSATEIVAGMTTLNGWQLAGSGTDLSLVRQFEFGDFHQTMAFANAVAWVAHTLNHHPEMNLQACRCVVHWSTHELGGLSHLDLDAAARVDALHATATPGGSAP